MMDVTDEFLKLADCNRSTIQNPKSKIQNGMSILLAISTALKQDLTRQLIVIRFGNWTNAIKIWEILRSAAIDRMG
jgi:hypothetical protein